MVTDGPGDVITGWGGGGGVGRSGCGLGSTGREKEGVWVRGREAMPPITIIFHHPNYIVECVSRWHVHTQSCCWEKSEADRHK